VCSLRNRNPTEQETTPRAGRELHLGAYLSACRDAQEDSEPHLWTADVPNIHVSFS